MKEITRKDLQSMDAPADGWYIIEAAGDHPKDISLTDGSRVEIMQRLTPEVLARVAAAGVPPEGLFIDQDHLSHNLGNTTEAMGWVRELAMCEGDMAARIEWSSVGMELVSGRVYKHFSTEYAAPRHREIAAGVMEPDYLRGLALTNKPNNWRGQPPITNRKAETPAPQAPSSQIQNQKDFQPPQGAEAKTQTNTQTMQYNPELLALLGLADGATDEEVLTAVRALKDGADAAAEAEAEALVNSEEAKEGVELSEEEKKECREEVVTNRARGLRYTSMLCQNKRLSKAPAAGAVTNRYAGAGRTPALTNRKSPQAAEQVICNRANEIIAERARNGQKMSWWTAVSQARLENPNK
ncbi:MAG: hypothetical protein J1E42_06615 [Akkermansiaceae bacterium]|nr:hypothetical protein [Akkermansiaceae bacterium]